MRADNAMALDLKRARAIAVDVWNKAVLDDLIDGSHSQIRERKPGYYWVRRIWREPDEIGPWVIFEYAEGRWLVPHGDCIDDVSEEEASVLFANIGPMVTMPDGLPTEPDMRD